eukprot:10261323-Lingulodinium_polyedra.AAC.1
MPPQLMVTRPTVWGNQSSFSSGIPSHVSMCCYKCVPADMLETLLALLNASGCAHLASLEVSSASVQQLNTCLSHARTRRKAIALSRGVWLTTC